MSPLDSDTEHYRQFRAPIADIELVRATMRRYTDGVRDGDYDLVRTAFRTDACMFGWDHDDFSAGNIENLFTWLTGHAPADGETPGTLRTHIDVLDITPTTAVAKVTLEYDFAGTDPTHTQFTTDYHSLAKVDGEWLIVAKLFHWYNY